ncbi:hypothetical protein RsTz2092_13730 [Deferribacterales bacterium RsTz2092]|nr:hypothetical protein AGMMS49941_12970 [Deferribacterales bacterium]
MESYNDFFEFIESPFKRVSDTDFYFPSKTHQEALTMLTYLLMSDDEFALLMGEPGAGKSIVLRKFIGELSQDVVHAYIMFPYLQPDNFFRTVLECFNVSVDSNMSDNALYERLCDFLLEQYKRGKKVLIIIDEAQNVPSATLEVVRIISNIETNMKKLLKIVLVGQPSLVNKLSSSSQLDALKQKILLKSTLKAFTPDDVLSYVNYTLEAAGGKHLAISKTQAKKICYSTGGNTWRINVLMERVLLVAHMNNSKTIKNDYITSAIKSMNIIGKSNSLFTYSRVVPAIIVTFLIVAISVAGVFGYRRIERLAMVAPVAPVAPKIVQAVRQCGATIFCGDRNIYRRLSELNFDGSWLQSTLTLLAYTTSGAPDKGLSLEFARLCATKGVRFATLYGTAASIAQTAYLPAEYAIHKAGSIGVAPAAGQLHIGNNSELILHDRSVMMGIAYSRLDLANGDELKGVLNSGVKASCDDEGFYFIAG